MEVSSRDCCVRMLYFDNLKMSWFLVIKSLFSLYFGLFSRNTLLKPKTTVYFIKLPPQFWSHPYAFTLYFDLILFYWNQKKLRKNGKITLLDKIYKDTSAMTKNREITLEKFAFSNNRHRFCVAYTKCIATLWYRLIYLFIYLFIYLSTRIERLSRGLV